MMDIVELPPGMTSFHDVLEMCKHADKNQVLVKRLFFGQIWVFVAPGNNPHYVYSQYFPWMTSNTRTI